MHLRQFGRVRKTRKISETLGMAFEPEQKYENPDGSPIIFNQDFFGNHRDVKTVAGPFTDKKASEQKLF